jgi:ACS family sodium-dependent inorganic phosphate cotransporter
MAVCAAAANVDASVFPDPASDPAAMGSAASVSSLADEKRILWMCAGAMLLASADRTIFSLASLAISTDLGFGMSALGLLQVGPGA